MLEQPQGPLPSLASNRILAKLLQLYRDIRRDRSYVGHSAFIFFALVHQRRPFIWEGSSRIDLIETYAPWAAERCARSCVVDAVCCCFQDTGKGAPEMVPVSERHPLAMCRHYVAATRIIDKEPGEVVHGLAFEDFYYRLGVSLLGTVMDGDCGPDVWCQMLAIEQTAKNRSALREESHMLIIKLFIVVFLL